MVFNGYSPPAGWIQRSDLHTNFIFQGDADKLLCRDGQECSESVSAGFKKNIKWEKSE